MGETSNTVISAKVYRKNVDVTSEYAATAFNWTRTSSDESADASWNAAHSGMKSITVSVSELSDDIQIQCTLTGTSPAYGSVDVNDSFIASHTRGEADSNDTLSLENGTLFVTTDDDNYRLSGNELKALYPRLNGTVTANAWVYRSQPTKTIEFKYNSASLRVQKKVTANGKSETTDYTLHGKLVTHMTVGNDKLHFFYDNSSRPAKVDFNGTTYTYLHNLQGDIVGILDNGGNLVVEYKYDAWGRSISITGLLAATLGKHNPFRYRGYVYDEESGLYYLENRYCNTEWHRFINVDNILGQLDCFKNAFAYCDNRCIVRCDPSGQASKNIFTDACNAIGGFFSNKVAPFARKTVEQAKNSACAAWNTAKFVCNNYIAPTAKKSWKSLKALIGGFGLDAGVGLGVGGEFDLVVCNAGALFRNDLVSFGGSLKEGARLGALYEYSMGLSIGVPNSKASIGGNMAATYFHPVGADNCECSSFLAYMPSCPAAEYDFSTDVVWTLGGSFYCFVGGTLQVTYNQSQVQRDLIEIWN